MMFQGTVDELLTRSLMNHALASRNQEMFEQLTKGEYLIYSEEEIKQEDTQQSLDKLFESNKIGVSEYLARINALWNKQSIE